MKCLFKPRHLVALSIALASLSTAHAIPTTTVNFQPGNGQLTFEFAAGAAEFDGTACDTCDPTNINWTDPLGHLWTSVSNISDFGATFSSSGELILWHVTLFEDLTEQTLADDGNLYRTGTQSSAQADETSQTALREVFKVACRQELEVDKLGNEIPGPIRCFKFGTAGEAQPEQTSFTADTRIPISEPATLPLLSVGLLVVAQLRRRRVRA